MSHAFLTDTKFYQLLTRIDESIAEEVRAGGCSCGARCTVRTTRASRVVCDRPWTSATTVA